MENIEDVCRRIAVAPYKKKLIGSPYSIKETIGWLYRNGFKPSKKNPMKVVDLPHEVEYISPKHLHDHITIGFLGDIMDTQSRPLKFSEGYCQFFQECDVIVGNFEATIVESRGKTMQQSHTTQILEAIAQLGDPNHIFLNLANNHAGDFPPPMFVKSLKKIVEKGFQVFGLTDIPYVDITPEIRIVGTTMWSNLTCDFINQFRIDNHAAILDQIDSKKFNILFPHWGYEMELFPRREIVKIAKEWLKVFDLIVGHHSHTPQPIVNLSQSIENPQIVAFSLGDVSFGLHYHAYDFGKVMKIMIGKDETGQIRLGKISWQYSQVINKSENPEVILVSDDQINI